MVLQSAVAAAEILTVCTAVGMSSIFVRLPLRGFFHPFFSRGSSSSLGRLGSPYPRHGGRSGKSRAQTSHHWAPSAVCTVLPDVTKRQIPNTFAKAAGDLTFLFTQRQLFFTFKRPWDPLRMRGQRHTITTSSLVLYCKLSLRLTKKTTLDGCRFFHLPTPNIAVPYPLRKTPLPNLVGGGHLLAVANYPLFDTSKVRRSCCLSWYRVNDDYFTSCHQPPPLPTVDTTSGYQQSPHHPPPPLHPHHPLSGIV